MPADLVSVRPLLPDRAIPALVTPNVSGLDLAEWARTQRAQLDALLLAHRALLFRGFDVRTADGFQACVMAASDGKLLTYRDRTTPRETVGAGIYTSTIHPADQRIELHNEGTYWTRWALRLFFCCARAADTGGATPIADMRRVHDQVDPSVREEFVAKKFMLVRNYNAGFGLPWQEVFQTRDAAEVETYCRENRIQWEWKEDGRLRTRQVRPAVRRHPQTGEAVWFNHATFFHHTSLEPGMREALLAEFGIEGLPYNTCYGDGSSIPEAVVQHLREVHAREKVVFPWQTGDVGLLDNMTVAHAREPYTGAREVWVAMTDAYDPGDA